MTLLLRATTTPDYVGVYLPAVMLTGIGVALVLPQLSSASVKDLPADQFGSGSAVNQAMRNLAATLGVAAVVALTAGITSDTALDAFHQVWWLIVVSGVTVTGLSTLLPKRVRARAGTAGADPVDVELAELAGIVAAEVPA